MEYPIIEKGREVGRLKISSHGLYTLFEAKLPPKSGLYRLWLIGEDANFCLGLLEPRNSGRYLSRSLSREALARLPRQIKYALCTESRAVFRLRKPQSSESVQPVNIQTQTLSLNWKAIDRGCYTAADSLSRLIAIPTTIKQDERLRIVTIKGCPYMVFRY